MNYYIDLLIQNQILLTICVILIFILLLYIACIIEKFFCDIFKLSLIIYAIYFPIGAFMAIHYWIFTKDWFSRENTFTLSFLYCSIYTIMLIIYQFLIPKLPYYKAKSSLGYMFEKEHLQNKLGLVSIFSLYSNFFIGIYTIICFIKLIIK